MTVHANAPSRTVVSWDEAFERLKNYATVYGDPRPAQNYADRDGFRLGKWVHNQRTAYRTLNNPGAPARRGLKAERVAALETLPGWTRNTKAPHARYAPNQPATRATEPVTVSEHSRSSSTGTALHGTPPTLLEYSVFKTEAVNSASVRALVVWLLSMPPETPFNETTVDTNPECSALFKQELTRLTIAALASNGRVVLRNSVGDLAPWETLLKPDEKPELWSYENVPSPVIDAKEYVVDTVLRLYEQETSTISE